MGIENTIFALFSHIIFNKRCIFFCQMAFTIPFLDLILNVYLIQITYSQAAEVIRLYRDFPINKKEGLING